MNTALNQPQAVRSQIKPDNQKGHPKPCAGDHDAAFRAALGFVMSNPENVKTMEALAKV